MFGALALALLYHLRRNPLAVTRWRLAHAAGLIAVCLLICFQALAYLGLHIGSVYSIAKYLYLLGTELAVLLIGVRWKVSPVFTVSRKSIDHKQLLAVLFYCFSRRVHFCRRHTIRHC